MNKKPEENLIAKKPEKEESLKDTDEDSDTDLDKRGHSLSLLKDFRRELHKLRKSTMKASQQVDDLKMGWKNEDERLEGQNIKLMQFTQKLMPNKWLIDSDDEAEFRRSQFVSKIPKPKYSSKVRPMAKMENSQSNIPIKISVIDKNNKKQPIKLDEML